MPNEECRHDDGAYASETGRAGLAVTRSGTGGFLLVPPLGADASFWDETVPMLQQCLPCLACDLPPGAVVSAAMALDDRRRGAGWDWVVAVGCAIGAMVAAAYAAGMPGHVAALVLTNATDRTAAPAAAMLQDRAAQVRAGGMAAILPAAVDRAFLGQALDERYGRYFARFAAQDAEAYAAAAEASAGHDVSALLPAIRCPTLVVAGGQDVLLPPALSQRVHAAIPGARLETFVEAAHFVPYQAPERFAALASAFAAAALEIDVGQESTTTCDAKASSSS